jgi:outer membrane protein OmpA-like peptidoglycan-associated protein/tetratricopeptide (TPR) repeat protein
VYKTTDKPKDYGIKSGKAHKSYHYGIEAMMMRDFTLARKAFEAAVAEEPDFVHAWAGLSEALYRSRRYIELVEPANQLIRSRQLVREGSRAKDKFPEADFYLGIGLSEKGDYIDAQQALNNYLASADSNANKRQMAQLRLRHLAFAIEAVKNPLPFKPQNLGAEVNTPGEEYMPYLTADEQMLFFTSRRAGNLGSRNTNNASYYDEDFYFSELKNGKWQKAQNLGAPINTDGNEGSACFLPDGQRVFFVACDRIEGLGSCDIYTAQLAGVEWLAPKNLRAINSPQWDSYPYITNDGKTLYFASARPGGLGESDIWFSEWKNGQWSAPQNLGAPINTPGREYCPFLHADGQTLYFSSDYHLGFGGLDLFISRKDSAGNWTMPKNLGYPLNTSGDEVNLFINTAGNRGYYNSSRRPEGFGGNDLYTFEMAPENRPLQAVWIRGSVTDAKTQQPVSTQITLIDLITRDTVRKVTVNKATGKFLLTLPGGREYIAQVSKKGYLFYSDTFSLAQLSTLDKHFELPINLLPIEKNATTELKIFFAFNSDSLDSRSQIELDQVVKFLKENPGIRIELGAHTDDQGTADYNLKLSKKRAESTANYLIRNKIDANRIVAVGYGESQPAVPNDSEANRARNRRTVMKIIE